ncbi:hypothetical protein V4287_000398 [Serratia marcescens]|uniref:hypothetical protein n=1 Tax=Serratia marcescens TaxID=615 RepID=UPI0006676F68|nr:hypothetical protein [Serratia marcescens]MBH3149736.1 hypothetical protein [Serratia marcescens]MBH3164701.1 hypothetical protein [Serratia marcescens]HEJ7011219.1 hypothetical protein [Serratia marcescens]HEJ7201446.1 hypothetical protein [Serratia marcescens]HEJ7237747.1 hypothetical protein [Serratia marcescens]
MSFYDSSKVSNINKTNARITRDVTSHVSEYKFDINEDEYSNEDKEVFFYSVLGSAWAIFYELFNNKRDSLDKNTIFNQTHIASSIEFTEEDYSNDPVSFLSNLLRVLFEFDYWVGLQTSYKILDHEILTKLDKLYAEKEWSLYYQFKWVRDKLSVALAKFVIDSKEFVEARELVATITNRREKISSEIDFKLGEATERIGSEKSEALREIANRYNDIIKEIRDTEAGVTESVENIKLKSEQVNALEDRISKLRTEYNFVGISSGFNKIKEKKELELRTCEIQYINLFGCLFIAPVIAVLFYFFKSEVIPKDFSVVFFLFPFVTIELALIYYFRLLYLEAKSIRTQLIQIELRLSLCAFIENYMEFRKDNHATGDKTLDSFDSLIFSPIQVNDNNIPSMFDGVDAIADLAAKIMKGKSGN